VGDYVVVDRGYVTQKLTEEQALAAWAVYDEMLGPLAGDA
jgi:hydrogenase maturation factor